MNSVQAGKSIILAGLVAANLVHPVAFGAETSYQSPDRGPVTFEFRFRQDDLVTQRGAHSVYRTLVYRAMQACTDLGEPGGSLRRVDRECVAVLVERVVRQIGSETLAREWRSTQPSDMALAQVM